MPLPVLVVADIHGNLEALKAVFQETAGLVGETWVLGDVAGYGPDPGKCIDLLLQREALVTAGNHDWAVCGKLDVAGFNEEARLAALLHRKLLSTKHMEFLASLPEQAVRRSVSLSHGDPRKPIWGYVLNNAAAAGVLAEAQNSLSLVGHTHIPGLWAYDPQHGARFIETTYGTQLSYAGTPHLANPGSVGQSRDGDPAARYMILNPEKKILEFRRCSWNSAPTRRKMKRLGFPVGLIERMAPRNRLL